MKRHYYYGYRPDNTHFTSLQAFDSKAERDAKLKTSKDIELRRADIDAFFGRGKWVIATDGSHAIVKKSSLMMEV